MAEQSINETSTSSAVPEPKLLYTTKHEPYTFWFDSGMSSMGLVSFQRGFRQKYYDACVEKVRLLTINPSTPEIKFRIKMVSIWKRHYYQMSKLFDDLVPVFCYMPDMDNEESIRDKALTRFEIGTDEEQRRLSTALTQIERFTDEDTYPLPFDPVALDVVL